MKTHFLMFLSVLFLTSGCLQLQQDADGNSLDDSGETIGRGYAKNQTKKKGQSRPCEREIRTYCSEAEPQEIGDCLDENFAQLGSQCQRFHAEMKTKRQAVEAACGADFEGLCEIDREIFECVREHHLAGDFSDTCSAALEANRPPGPPPPRR